MARGSPPVPATDQWGPSFAVDEPEKLLPRFGLDSFRPGQREVIEAVLAGRDTLCIMPTGGGKSLCYQLPSLARPGVTVVVSPLIALMKDQVDSLAGCGIAAACINSSMSLAEQGEKMDALLRGEYRLLYVAPERLRHGGFLRAIQNVDVQMLAVDEAHCISQWGHDFRPDYARLGKFRQRIGNPQVVALTATATSLVQQDICTVLELREPARFVSGFARPNLSLAVETPAGNAARDRRLVAFLNAAAGGGIIYASTRKNCEHVVELVSSQTGLRPEFYHAGMPHEDRRRVQDNFMSGKTRVVVATNAFGMGIDKADLRYVVHYNLPGSLEAYYQEAGRAGRDGLPSRCLMLYSWQDRFIQEFFIENSYPSREIVRQVYGFLAAFEQEPVEITLQEIRDQLGLSIGTQGIANCENLLEKAGAIERLDSQRNMAAVRIASQLPSLVDLLPRGARTRRRVMLAIEKTVGPLRGELVLFDPRRLTEKLDLKWESIQESLRQFLAIPGFEYIPPFRGRAIHVRNRERKFADLEIDFAELDRRKKAEFDRLERVIRFATSGRCRQLDVLEYFGDSTGKACGCCDRCQPGLFDSPVWRSEPVPIPGSPSSNRGALPGQPSTAAAADPAHSLHSPENSRKNRPAAVLDGNALLYASQVALSGVARSRGRVGKLLVAEMLAGSQSKRLVKTGLGKLTTFGLLKALKKAGATDLLDWLIGQGYIQQVEQNRFRPVVQITPRGTDLMKGNLAVQLELEMPPDLARRLSTLFAGKRPAGTSPPALKPADPAFSREQVPRAAEPAGKTTGQPPSTGNTFSDDPRRTVNKASEPHRSDGDPEPVAKAEPPKLPKDRQTGEASPIHPTHFWSWHLMQSGYALAEVAAIRGLEPATVIEHLIRAADDDLAVSPSWLLSTEQISRLDSMAENSPDHSIRLRSDLPEGITPLLNRFFASCRRRKVP